MKKKVLAVALAAALAATGVASFAGCGAKTDVKIGFMTLHDDQSTYDKNFIDAIKVACENKGIDEDNLIIKTGIPESNKVTQTALDLVDLGCNLIFADSFGHEAHLLAAAKESEGVQFCHATGVMAKTANQANFHNAFASIYEGRYLAGVAAGYKLLDMYGKTEETAAEITAEQAKLGYIGAFTYAEVMSGYTSWFLGVQSVVPAANMEVTFTGSWYDEAKEKEAANMLIDNGCKLISQHADSMGAPGACEKAGVPNVAYNVSTEADCPNTFIIASKINWVPYFEYIIDQVANNQAIDTNWTGTMANNSVQVTALGAAAAAGTQAKLDAVKAKLANGTLKVFDTTKFTVNGAALTTYLADTDGDFTGDTEAIIGGEFKESYHRSAPYFDVEIDGITLLDRNYGEEE